ncbi:alpha/beta fold hydrolase [Acinetobacter pragensis]|uniref:AB hydrolase-1 domain-containing protein n=1 Tax=Acinetobacter pragensis TaxID=1806892 RepID=A0A151Y4E3_9GAMM|nr:alpha/beta hydrolase [Acinetobacter pragensis]KYQ72849.1 hypothetical protein AZH43_08335 [Acinetobacter pragensis]
MPTPIIFLSGLLCDHSIWRAQQDFFSEQYDVSVFCFPDINCMEQMAKRVIHQLHAPSVIIGHSMGACVALEIIRQAPELVSKIALLDFGIHPQKALEAEKRYALLRAAEQHGMVYLVEHWLKPMIYEGNRSNPQMFEPMKQMLLQQTAGSFEQQIQALLNRPNAEQVFRRIDVPLYLGVGRNDQWSTLEQHESMCVLNPAAELHIYEHCGHMSPIEAADQVNITLQHWLERNPLQR